MKKFVNFFVDTTKAFLDRLGFGMKGKLIIIFILIKVIPLILLTAMAWHQIVMLGNTVKDIAVSDSSDALNASATENIERMTTDTAKRVAGFLYARDGDILYIANIEPSEKNYRQFIDNKLGNIVKKGDWQIATDGKSWVSAETTPLSTIEGISSNRENNDMDGFHYRQPEVFDYENVPLYDEITFVDLAGNEQVKVVAASSPKVNYPLNSERKNISQKENTYIKAETYFEELKKLKPGEIYVSDVVGAYVGTNYIGMYTLKTVSEAEKARGYDIPYNPAEQAYAGMENPNGKRFEGIVRWATPVTDDKGNIIGYVTFALNHDHIMEFVDHITPMSERYTKLPNAYDGNYAFIWDYKCRNICHPRHHSITGFDPETGDPQIPWLETSIYNAWQASGIKKWTDFIKDQPTFDAQSRDKKPAAALTKSGMVGLDGRYLNNAPQCTGWMDLTENGGSGSFYILWSGLYKLTTAAAIPYYTGQYAPSESNNYSKRGFGFVAIGAGLEDFTKPAKVTEEKLVVAVKDNITNTFVQLVTITAIIIVLVVFIAIWMASFLTDNITRLINGISRFRAGERHFRFNLPVKDEFDTLADSFDDMADSIVGSVNSPLCITDMDGKIIYMNDYALELCKKTLPEIVGTLYSENSVYPTHSKFCPITALEEGHEAEALYLAENKTYVKGVANYLWDKDGQKIGYVIVTTDVTEIQNAREKAEQANKAKTIFLSNMSHEMRTPLNAVIGMTSIGKSASDIKRKDYCLKKIEDASTHLLSIINDILDMSKIEASKFHLSPTEFNFEKMLQKVLNIISIRIDEKQQQFVVHVDKNIPCTMFGDEQRLAQIITNLLSNAVKFTPEYGAVRLEARLIEEKNELCTIQIEVTDTGIGIDEEQQSRIFTAFEQAESSTSRKFGGTGLGLAISKHIIEMMGGEILVKSEFGKGSAFTLTVPLKCGDKASQNMLTPNINRKSLRVLAVDGALEIREYFMDIAQQLGFVCDVAANGEEAISAIEQNDCYDFYFIDWKLANMDGIELSRQGKECGADSFVVVMVSAMHWNITEIETKNAGVDKFLPKPFLPFTITECINECFAERNLLSQEDLSDEIPCFEGYRVLLAEDVSINREIVMALLEPTLLMIECAENGAEAVKMYSESPERYDMIFMDVQMPEMDGYEATRRIRTLDVLTAKSVPIIAMTANVFREDVEKCIAAGMNDHLGKPLEFDEVLSKLKKYLPKKPSGL